MTTRNATSGPRGHTRGLAVERVTVDYGSQRALHDVSVSFASSAVHALLGPNGSGKSTLIKTLSGLIAPRQGAQFHLPNGRTVGALTPASARQAGLRFVHQDLGLLPELSVLENIFLANDYPTKGWQVRWGTARRLVNDALAVVGLDSVSPKQQIAELPHSAKVLVAVARAVMDLPTSGGCIFVDEPTAALDEGESDQLLSALHETAVRQGLTVVLVTHRLREVLKYAERVTVLRDGVVAVESDRSDIDAAGLHRALGGTAPAAGEADYAARIPATGDGDVVALSVADLAGRQVRGVSFAVPRGEIFGVTGLEGSGKEELFRLLCGSQRRAGGTVVVGGAEMEPRTEADALRRGIGIVPGERLTLGGIHDMSVADNLMLPRLRRFQQGGFFRGRRMRAAARDELVRYDVNPPDPVRLFGTLSGGNQQKTVLARWLAQNVPLLVLQEPTAGVDVVSRARIYAELRRAVREGATAVVVSSDLGEVAELCDRAAVMVDGHISTVLAGPDLTYDKLVAASFDLASRPSPSAGVP